jgi:hypothetical protein
MIGAGMSENKAFSIVTMVLAIIVTILNALIFLGLAIISAICKEIEAYASDACNNAVDGDKTCFWFCDKQDDCNGNGCVWKSDTCHDCSHGLGIDSSDADACVAPSTGRPGAIDYTAGSQCKGCEEGVTVCDHIVIINVLVGGIFVIAIVGTVMSCCIACCGKDELDSADDDSGVQKLER